MNMNDLPLAQAAAAPAASPQVFQQLGQITRQLHDTLSQLGVMPKLQQSAVDLPDARSRLTYIARKTGEAADKVLTAVDLAKADQAFIAKAAAAMGSAGDPIAAAVARIDTHLTDIMLAQDFHDLTGQVVAKVVTLAGDLEDSLVKLLLQAAPLEQAAKAEAAALAGPVVDAAGRTDVVSNQGEVDDLLASLGF
jgi:chemotaxis protein CheZ